MAGLYVGQNVLLHEEAKADVLQNGRSREACFIEDDGRSRRQLGSQRHDRRVSRGGPQRYAIVGSASYFAHHDRPRVPRDLLERRCIRVRLPTERTKSTVMSG